MYLYIYIHKHPMYVKLLTHTHIGIAANSRRSTHIARGKRSRPRGTRCSVQFRNSQHATELTV